MSERNTPTNGQLRRMRQPPSSGNGRARCSAPRERSSAAKDREGAELERERGRLSREQYNSRAGQRTRELREDSQVGVEPYPIQASDAEARERSFMLGP